MKDYQISLNKKCQCRQKDCPIRGNCVLCIQNHIEKGNHMPECMQNMIRSNIKAMAEIVEYHCKDKRPKEGFWDSYDKDKLVRTSIERHETNS